MPAKSSAAKDDRHSQDAYLHDMLESAQYVQRYMEGVDFDVFWNDSEKRDAVAMRLSVIGESARHLTSETEAKFKSIPFKDIRGMSNRIAHEYGRVDYTVVWTVTQEDVGPLVIPLVNHFSRPHDPQPPSSS